MHWATRKSFAYPQTTKPSATIAAKFPEQKGSLSKMDRLNWVEYLECVCLKALVKCQPNLETRAKHAVQTEVCGHLAPIRQAHRHTVHACTCLSLHRFLFFFEVMYLFFEPRFASEIALSELCAVEVVALTALPVLIVPGKTTHAYLRLQRVLGRCLGVHVQCLTRSPHGDYYYLLPMAVWPNTPLHRPWVWRRSHEDSIRRFVAVAERSAHACEEMT